MKTRKILALVLAALMSVALFAGCGQSGAAPAAPAAEKSEAAAPAAEKSEAAAPAAEASSAASEAPAAEASSAASEAPAAPAGDAAVVPAVPDLGGKTSLEWLLDQDDKLPLGGLQPAHLDSRADIDKALDNFKEDDNFTVAWASASQGSSFFTEMVRSAKEEAESYGWTFLNQSAEFDMATQQNQIENFLTQDIDVLVVNAVDIDACMQYFRQAVDKGIPVFCCGPTAGKPDYPVVTVVVSGSFESGYAVGEYCAEKLWGQFPDGVNFGAVISRAGDADSNSRPCGFVSGYLHKYAELAGQPYESKWDATVIGYQTWVECRDSGSSSIPGIINLVGYGAAGATDAASAQPVAADLLTAHPEMELIMSETDSLCPAIFQEAIQHGRVPGDDLLIVCGADSADYTLEHIKSGEYLAVGNNAPYYTGEGIIKMIKAILDGKLDGNNLPATSYTPTYAVTPENIDEVWDGSAAFAAASEWEVQTIDDYNAANGG